MRERLSLLPRRERRTYLARVAIATQWNARSPGIADEHDDIIADFHVDQPRPGDIEAPEECETGVHACVVDADEATPGPSGSERASREPADIATWLRKLVNSPSGTSISSPK